MYPRCPYCGNQHGASETYNGGKPAWGCLECGKLWPRPLSSHRAGQSLGQGGTVPGAASGAGGTVDASPTADPFGIQGLQQSIEGAASDVQKSLSTQGGNVQGAATKTGAQVQASAASLSTVFLLGVGALALVLIFTKR